MKNKKLLVALCIPLIISIMVLPLCSFTPSESTSTDLSGNDGSNISIYRSTPVFSFLTRSEFYQDENDDLHYLYESFVDYNSVTVINDDLSMLQNDSYSANEVMTLDHVSTISDYVVSSPFGTFSTGTTWSDSSHNKVNARHLFISYETNIVPYIEFKGSTYVNRISGSLYNTYYDDVSIAFANLDTGVNYDMFIDSSIYFKFDMICTVSSDIQTAPIGQHYSFSVRGDNFAYYGNLGSLIKQYLESLSDIVLSIDYLKLTSLNVDGSPSFLSDALYVSMPLERTFSNLSEQYNNGFVTGYEEGYHDGVNSVVVPPNYDSFSSLGEFLITSVGAFTEFEIIPNVISIGDVIAIFVSASLIIAFLKIFAGG